MSFSALDKNLMVVGMTLSRLQPDLFWRTCKWSKGFWVMK